MNVVMAVYGTLKKGFYNHYLMEGSRFMGEGVARGKMYSAGGFPIVTKEGGDVQVELYEVDKENLGPIDSLEGHPQWYVREQVPVRTKDGTVRAWMYFQRPEEVTALSVVEDGVWR